MINCNFSQTILMIVVMTVPARVNADDGVPTFDSLADLFAANAPLDANNVKFERDISENVDCRFHEGRQMKRIALKFVSQVYRGVRCTHDAVVFLPTEEQPKAARGAVAIILGGNQLNVSDRRLDRVESIVVEMGVPCMVVKEALRAKEFGARNAGELMSFGQRTFMETGDPRTSGYYALARIFSAAVSVASRLPELDAKRFVVSGGSKGGMAAMIACAGDPRIVGAYPTAWNVGNFVEATRLKGERWGWDVKPKPTGPAGETARTMQKMFATPRGQEYRRLFEPVQWGELLRDKIVIPAVGTNDPLFHLLSDNYYFDKLPCRKSLVRVPNYGHGASHRQHATGWRFLVASALLGRPIPNAKIEAREDDDQVAIYVTANGAENVRRAVLWVASDPVGDYRQAKWEIRHRLEKPPPGQPAFVTHLPKPDAGTTACFVHLVDDGKLTVAIASSNVVEIGTPVLRH